MGGRGSFSYGGQNYDFDSKASSNGTPGVLAPENRSSVKDMARAAGFDRVMGTSKIDEETMRASLNRIRQLEGKYGAIAESEDPVLVGTVAGNAIAYVHNDAGNNRAQSLAFSTKLMKDAEKLYEATKHAIDKGHFMPTNNDRTTIIGYTATHEYGHMLENILYARNGNGMAESTYAQQVRDEILSIAKIKYNGRATRGLSKYGATNAYEFFAEAFANANSGNPNAIGRAMDTWLKRQGF